MDIEDMLVSYGGTVDAGETSRAFLRPGRFRSDFRHGYTAPRTILFQLLGQPIVHQNQAFALIFARGRLHKPFGAHIFGYIPPYGRGPHTSDLALHIQRVVVFRRGPLQAPDRILIARRARRSAAFPVILLVVHLYQCGMPLAGGTRRWNIDTRETYLSPISRTWGLRIWELSASQ
jgi:hypothetical protein